MYIFKNTHFDFLRWRVHAIVASWIVILAGVFTLYTKGIPKGVEFAGGNVVIQQFEQPVAVQQVRNALDKTYKDAIIQSYGDPSQRNVMIRVSNVGAEAGASLSSEALKIEAALRQGGLPPFKQVSSEIVGPAVGQELTT